jgi:hypothetical protein
MSSFRSSSLVRTAFSADMALIINNVPPIFIVKAVSVFFRQSPPQNKDFILQPDKVPRSHEVMGITEVVKEL